MRQEYLFLVRFWRDGDRSEDWRASATDLRNKRIIRFASLAALHRFFEEQAGVMEEAAVHKPAEGSGLSPGPEEE